MLFWRKTKKDDYKILFRPIGFTDWAFVLVACATDCGHHGEGEDAGRTGFLCAEESGEGWKVV